MRFQEINTRENMIELVPLDQIKYQVTQQKVRKLMSNNNFKVIANVTYFWSTNNLTK